MVIDLKNVVDKLLGQYAAYGEHHGDMEAYENLDNVNDILLHLVDRLCDNVRKGRDTIAYSIVEVGKKSEKILRYAKEQIEDNDI